MDDDFHRSFEAVARELAREITMDAIDFPDESTDVSAVRESLIRHRMAAAAMQQAHRSRAAVCDVFISPDGLSARMVVATPSGDRRDERELMVEAQTAARVVVATVAREHERARIVAFLFPWLLGAL